MGEVDPVHQIATEEEVFTQSDELEKTFSDSLAKINNVLDNKSEFDILSSFQDPHKITSTKLPKIPVPTFDGDI